jgi:hypothetical protein
MEDIKLILICYTVALLVTGGLFYGMGRALGVI